jgi:hypothetical protein
MLQYNKSVSINCPHRDCDHLFDTLEISGSWVSLYGSDESYPALCPECDRPMLISEKVERTYLTTIPEGYLAQNDRAD